MKFSRKKAKYPILLIVCKLKFFFPFIKENKFKLFLGLEWVFNKLAYEESFNTYSVNDHVSELDRVKLRELIEKCGSSIQKEEYRLGVQNI